MRAGSVHTIKRWIEPKVTQAWAWLNAARKHQTRLFAYWALISRTSGRPVGVR